MYAYIKVHKVGDLPEGEYPYNVIRVPEEDVELLKSSGYEDATHEEWLEFGGVPANFEANEEGENGGEAQEVSA